MLINKFSLNTISTQFRSSDYGENILPEDIYHGVHLTSMKIAIFESQADFKAEKKAAFIPMEEI